MHNTEPPIGQDAAGQATAQQPPAGRRMYWLAGLRVNSSSGTTAMTSTMSGLRVDPSNAGQAKAWDGGEGTNWAAHAGHLDRTVAGYHLRFLEAAAVGAGEWVLDIGCGTGQVTRDAARRAASGGALGWTWRRAQALAALRATITAHANTDGILYKSATWLIRARRA